MDSNKKNELEVIKRLQSLNSVPGRDSQKVANAKAAFLAEAASFQKSVTPGEELRHKRWNEKKTNPSFFRRKEYKPMLSTFASIVIAVTLLLGGSGATVAAAQSSLPGDILYDLKLLSENTASQFVTDPEAQFDLSLDLLDRRAEEIQTLLLDGQVPAEETITRYQDQIEQAIILALNLSEDQVAQAFAQIQTRLQTQEQTMAQIRVNASPEALQYMLQTQEMVQERLQILSSGEESYLQIQDQLRLQDQLENPDQNQNEPPWAEQTETTVPSQGNGSQGENNPNVAETGATEEMTSTENGQNGQNTQVAPVQQGSGSNQLSATPTRTPTVQRGNNGSTGSQGSTGSGGSSRN